ncbi:YeeE/YedE thiosulfate transporter family protein [Pseudomonas sp. 10S4]|uniref:YeeE/YedE thiosulfate transporter family protein n=2 Tax=Pseudomonas TaxID=286 RepID=UPI001911E8AE|nr:MULTISPECIES: YeeE/YedE thiosulfate transporter family protein [unclassified Pseudomonas]MBK5549078.1 YeeE/YedE family protein [Pseudomonas sp. TH03]MEB0223054.1 YeeE/YedE thiosulfate transporter family protein [Pseudomonas sp. 5S1]WPX20651.1 YeeE/YedE thiosulfate transporter family protein [Pseudomonas sp. 10S4]
MLSLLISLLLSFLIGWVSQRMGMCLVKAIGLLLNRRPTLFVSLIACGLFGLLLAPFYSLFGISQPLFIPEVGYLSLVAGGLLFGLASVLNDGCSVGTLTKLASGNLTKVFTILGWVLGIVLWHHLNMLPEHKTLQMPTITSGHYWLTLGILLAALLFLIRVHGDKHLVLSSMLLGALTSALYTFEPLWTPSVFFYNLSQMFWMPGEGSLTGERMAVFGMLIVGMLSYTLHRRTFSYERFEWRAAVKHLLAGVLMGIGASMMLGGNDSQILLVFPTLTWVGVVPLGAIVVGILVGVAGRRLGLRVVSAGER